MLTKAILTSLWPRCERSCPGLIDGVLASQDRVLNKYGLTSNLVLAHFMAQVSHEFGAGHDMVENLSYSAQRMTEVWPSRFHSIAEAEPYAHNPRALGNRVYNGRMGNRVGTDDGYNFRGRGGSQTTGREAYEKLGKIVGLDLINHPEYLSSPEHFLECSAADFVMCGCLPYAQRDDIYNVTQHLNGGQIGAAERREWLHKWKVALANSPAVAPAVAAAPLAKPAEPLQQPAPTPAPPAPPAAAQPAAAATPASDGWLSAFLTALGFKRP